MKAERCFSTYFHAIPALSNCQENSCKKNAINLLCLLSYFTVIIPLGMALAYRASLCGRAQPIDPKNPSPPLKQAFVSFDPTQDCQLPEPKAPSSKIMTTPETSNARDYPGDLSAQEGKAQNFQSDSLHPTQDCQLPEPKAPSSKIITTPETSKVRDYPGDLTAQEGKAQNFQIDKCDDYQLHSNTNSPTVQVYIRRADIFQSGAPVIVNAANTPLRGGGGIDGAIHKKGGKAYAQAHEALKNHYNSRYTEGYASMIESGNLKQKEPPIEHVIVVAGPRGPSNSPKKESQL